MLTKGSAGSDYVLFALVTEKETRLVVKCWAPHHTDLIQTTASLLISSVTLEKLGNLAKLSFRVYKVETVSSGCEG